MNLLIDIGNTRFKYALVNSFSSIELSELNETFTNTGSCANKQLTEQWLESKFSNVKQVVLASVNDDSYSTMVESWAKRHNALFTLVTAGKQFKGVNNGYDNFQQLGVDRWLGLLGAKHLFNNKSCLIIDSGTATTIDFLDESGKHFGGWIMPGVKMMATSVTQTAAKVEGDLKSIEELNFGKNTSENLSQASWAATIGAVNQALAVTKRKKIPVDIILFTGGNGRQLIKHCSFIEGCHEPVYVEQLILVGLNQYID